MSRAIALLAMIVALVHLPIAQVYAQCAHATQGATSGGEGGDEHDSHHAPEPAAPEPAAPEPAAPDCDVPAPDDCCQAMAACSLAIQLSSAVLVAESVPTAPPADMSEPTRPVSRHPAPEPPPPRA